MNFILSPSSQIQSWCDYFSDCPAVAIDTEFFRVNTYWPKLALIQLSDGKKTALIDPLDKKDNLDPVLNLLINKDVTKIFHSCRQDLEIILKDFGVLPVNIFDTQLAYGFLYPMEEISLAKLIEEQLGIILNKSKQNSNWMRRPLPESQLVYAANDVFYLPEIWKILSARLMDTKRMAWFHEEQTHDFAQSRFTAPANYWLRLAKRGNHQSRQLHILKSVCDWREVIAQELDYNRKRVLSDELILKLADDETIFAEALGTIPESKQESAKHMWVGTLEVPEQNWPAPLKRKPMTQKQQEQLERLKTMLDSVATDLGISQKLIATTDDLKSWIKDKSAVPFMNGWRLDVFGNQANSVK